jgi:hypothetical protein
MGIKSHVCAHALDCQRIACAHALDAWAPPTCIVGGAGLRAKKGN